MQICYNDILENDFILSMDSFKWIELNKTINNLKKTYPNLMNEFSSFDGYAFPSSDYVTRFEELTNKTHLIQIGNVNESEWILTDAQKFEFIPNSYLTKKKKYLLEKQHILISLTGGSNTSNDISSYFDGSFNAFLNQRVSAFSQINNDIDLFFLFLRINKKLVF